MSTVNIEELRLECDRRNQEIDGDSLEGYVVDNCDACGELKVCYDHGAFAGGFLALCDDCRVKG